ncbi:hypothetical protein ACKI1J_32130 [Streptomyces scabiei]|uniref:hypothetical protein n=1 Tax=Streptomyces scabiei TaxID=1930 RepID=UPI0039EE9CBA
MIPVLIGGSVLAACLAVLAAALWAWWRAGQGRHRRPRRVEAPARALLVTATAPELPCGTEAVLLTAPPVASTLHLRTEEEREAAAADPDTVALLEVDRADFAHCPKQGRRTPHFLHLDGSRTCCECETQTVGDLT